MQTDLRNLRSTVRSLTRNVPPAAREAFARAFVAHAMESYARATHPGAPVVSAPGSDGELDAELRAEAAGIGRHCAAMEGATAAYLLSTLYTQLLPDDLRSAQGMFFTPPPLVERLLDMAGHAGARWAEHSVVDPAAGGGAFVTPIARRMASALRTRGATPMEVIDHVAAHLTGVELDPFSGWLADVFLQLALWPLCERAGRPMPRVVFAADSLRVELGSRRYDAVIGNPPYGRVTLDPEQRRRYARSLHGHANLYGLFTDLAVQLCRPQGVIGYVTPASFLGGQYFKNLRALLAELAPPTAIDFVADRGGVFDRVLQETVLVVLRPGGTSDGVSVATTQPVGPEAGCQTTHIGAFPLPEEPHAPWVLPREPADAALLRGLAGMPHRLRDLGLAVSTGPLVWNRHRDQLATERGERCHPLIWAESVLPTGEFRFRADRRNHTPYVEVRPGQGHLLTSQPVVLVQRTTAKEQHRRLIAALLPVSFVEAHGAVVVENHLNMVLPSGTGPMVGLRAVCALLNSGVVDRIFRSISGSVAVSAFELESLPVPDPEVLRELDALLERGAGAEAVEFFLHGAYGVDRRVAAA